MLYAFCLEMLYTELPFLDRLHAAKQDGIDNIEFWSWQDKDLDLLNQYQTDLSLNISNISGNRQYGMIDPKERTLFLNEVNDSIEIAKSISCPRVMLLTQTLAGNGKAGSVPKNFSEVQINDEIITCGREIAALADRFEVDIVLEPLNSLVDHPGYMLDSSSLAFKIVSEINHPRFKILYDIYHMAMMGEDVIADIETNLDWIGYFHLADIPGRTEPGTGEISYKEIFSLLNSLRFNGIVGFECYPSGGDSHKAIQSIMSLLL